MRIGCIPGGHTSNEEARLYCWRVMEMMLSRGRATSRWAVLEVEQREKRCVAITVFSFCAAQVVRRLRGLEMRWALTRYVLGGNAEDTPDRRHHPYFEAFPFPNRGWWWIVNSTPYQPHAGRHIITCTYWLRQCCWRCICQASI